LRASGIRRIDAKSPPFDKLKGVRLLGADRKGPGSIEHARHQLYAGLDRQTRASVLVKVTSKPGIVYESNLANETATLSTINRELPRSFYFPEVFGQGRLRDSRLYLVMSLFDELPLAASVSDERRPDRMVANLRATIEVSRALAQLHALEIVHVDLNPMNILYRWEQSRPVIRIIDFESSYERARHGAGVFYNPPTTPGYSAPEVPAEKPDARADLFSLGAVLYTLLAGFAWTWKGEAGACVASDDDLDPELKAILLGMVDRDRDRRFASVQEFQAALAQYLERIWPGRSW